MNPKLKNVLLIFVKQAVNAVLASSILKVLVSGNFQFNSADSWWNFGKAMASVIIAREATVWVPVILKWTTTNADPQ
jgi:hypothetical protein